MWMSISLLLAAAAAVHGQSCGGALTVNEVGAVTISSPNHPQPYNSGASCTWTITGPSGKALKLTALSFDLEGSYPSCSFDYVDIDGTRYCGQNEPSGVVVASPATIRFVSDSSIVKNGFQISIEATTAVAGGCGGEVIVEKGKTAYFLSPRYPNNYPDNSNCIWFVRGPAGEALQFNSVTFDLEASCGYDSLLFSETVDGVVKNLGPFCSTSGPSRLRTSTNDITVRFKSDSSINKKGFNVTVRVDTCPGQNTCPNNESACISRDQYCDGVSQCPDGSDEQYCNLECGIPPIQPNLSLTKKDPKIVGGAEAIPHSWPWQVAFLTSSGSQICGATLINQNWVMTAAHCCAARAATPANYLVRIGAHDLSNSASEPSSKVHSLKRVIMHPSYGSSPATRFDFCLLELSEPAALGLEVVPACLASESDGPVGTECFITGWGNTSPRSSFKEFMELIDQAEAGKLSKEETASLTKASNVLNQVNVNINDQNQCNTAYGGVIEPNMICASAPGHDTCQGDSGGPLVCPKANGQPGFVLTGVTSWGRGCAQPGYPGIYARISHVLPWISETLVS
jgi:hypothetical protein